MLFRTITLFLLIFLSGNGWAEDQKIVETSTKITTEQTFIIYRQQLQGNAVKEIPAIINKIWPKLIKEVKKLNLKVTGPTYNIYQDMGDKTKDSFFELAIPVEKKVDNYQSKTFIFKTYKSSRYLCMMVKGQAPEMHWRKVITKARALKGFKPTGIDMEVYYHHDNDPKKNLTELRFGLEEVKP